jgi:hypothetical protein
MGPQDYSDILQEEHEGHGLGCFWDIGGSFLYIMDCDFESAKHGYSAASYLEVLEVEVAPIYSALPPGYIFMQDNASIYTAYKVRTDF